MFHSTSDPSMISGFQLQVGSGCSCVLNCFLSLVVQVSCGLQTFRGQTIGGRVL
jgi:hypothetical protein